MNARGVSTTAVVIASLASGCISTNYAGRDQRKVYQTMQDGQRGYTRGGVFRSDAFGGGLREVVAGNDRAMVAADTFHDRMVGGFAALMVGTVCLPVAIAYNVQQDAEQNRNFSTVNLVELGCTALLLGGAIAMATAPPYALDAVNMYNDDVDALGWQAPRFTAPQAPMMAPPMMGAPMPPSSGPPGY